MPTDVIMPALGVSQDTGKILRWIRSEGDTVAKGDPLMEIETDKVTVEIESPASGTLAGVSAPEGADVPVGQPVAVILAEGESVPAAVAPVEAPRPGRRLASPKARRLAQERGVDLDALAGSGPHGAVVAADLGSAAPEPPTTTLVRAGGAIWQRMAERTTASWQSIPHFYLERDVDAGQLNAWRETVRKREGYERLTHTDLLIKVAATALRRHPRVNGSDGDVNVGIAVAVEDGLVVPVVHEADRLDLREIAERRIEIVAAAREGKLKPEHVTGGTFTISNLGMFGIDAFQAIVNAPQAAILAVGRIADRVVAVDGQPAVRPRLTLSVSFDHRVVDGARGAGFVETLADLIEAPAGVID